MGPGWVKNDKNGYFHNISKENLNQVVDLNDSDISTVETKRGIKIQAHKQITTKSYKNLHKDFQQLYNITQPYHVEPLSMSNPFMSLTQLKKKQKCACAVNV